MFIDLIYHSLGKANIVEHLTLTTTSAAAISDSFSVISVSTAKDLLIQNMTDADCYINLGLEAVVATSDHTFLPAKSHIAICGAAFSYFSVIRATATNVTIRITGLGREEN